MGLTLRRPKALLGVAAALLLAALLAAAAGLSPRWLNREPVRGLIAARLSQALGGTVEFARIDLSLFPVPRLVLRGVRAEVRGKWSATARAAAVSPGFLPLLRGRLLAGTVRLEGPDVRADLAALSVLPREKPATLEELRGDVAALLARLAAAAPNVSVEATGGRAALYRGTGPLVTLENVEARLRLPPGALTADVRGSWDGGRTLSIRSTLDASTLDGSAEIVVARLDAAALAAALWPSAAIALARAEVGGTASIETSGLRSFRATVGASAPAAALRRGGRVLEARGLRLAGSVEAQPGRLSAALSKLSVASPPLQAAGRLEYLPAARRAGLSIEASDTTVAAARELVLFFSGDAEPARDLFARIESGRLPSLSFEAESRDLADPPAVDNLTLAARLRGGTVRVPEAELRFTAVDADVAVRRGFLSARKIAARLGRSQVRDGTLSLGLSGKTAAFRADLPIDADLPDIPPILARVSGSAALVRELALVEGLEGRASGRLVLGDRLDSLAAAVDVSAMRLLARYRRFPQPIRIDAGRFAYAGDRVSMHGVSGSAGHSTFADVAFVVRTGPAPVIEEASGRHVLALGELHPWVTSLPGMEAVAREVPTVDGTLAADVRSLSGPADSPRDWRVSADGSFRDIAASAKSLPGKLSVAAGTFRLLPGSLSLADVDARLLDASLALSGTLHPPFGYPRGLEAAGGGSLGPESVRWISERLEVPKEFEIRAPATVSGARLAWSSDNSVSAAGSVSIANGPTVSVDLRRRNGEIEVRDLSVRDEESRAGASLALTREAFGLSFAGHLAAGTLGRLFVGGQLPQGRVEGDFSVYAPRERPEQGTARGRLEARGIRFPRVLGALSIETLVLEASGRRVAIGPSALAWGTTRFTVSGSAQAAASGPRIDVDVGTPLLDWPALRASLPKAAAGGRELPGVTGVVRVAAETLFDGRRAWKPFRADVALEPGTTRIAVRRAGLCGVDARGEATITPAATSVDFRATASGSDVGPALSCLRHERVKMTGRYELDVRLKGSGAPDALPRALTGSFSLRASDGRIDRATVLSKVLAIVNLSQIIFLKIPDLAHRGFAYNKLTIRGDVAGGKLVLREATLDGASANLVAEGDYDFTADRLDLVVLASPLKTIDAILRRIPLVGYILGGSLVSVPVKVTGNPEDPAVSVLPPAQVGKGILGVVERTLKAPIKLIEPILPKRPR